MAINDTASRRAFERRFFLMIAILFPLTVIVGFGPTYYLKGFLTSPPVPSAMVHVHGLVMSAWVLLFVAQVYMIRSTRIKLHQRLGLAGIALAVVIVAAGLVTGIQSAKRGGGVPAPGTASVQACARSSATHVVVFTVVPVASRTSSVTSRGSGVTFTA
jgi:hypothetical protein